MKNPWETVALDVYEKHMSLDGVSQLQAMNAMMAQQFAAYTVHSIMILGVAGGNGLEHIDTSTVHTVYGVDVNEDYLRECNDRYPNLKGVLQTILADLTQQQVQLPVTELLVANLLIEYIGYECFQHVITKVQPAYVSTIIQVNTDDSFVSDSPYLHEFDCLDQVHHQIEEQELITKLQEIGYRKKLREERILPNAKKLIRIDFCR